MSSRIRRGVATGPAEWLLVFLQARDEPPRARLDTGLGPADWLLVFLSAANADPVRRGQVGAVLRSLQSGMEAEPEPVPYAASGA
jgi:hypothetical protein